MNKQELESKERICPTSLFLAELFYFLARAANGPGMVNVHPFPGSYTLLLLAAVSQLFTHPKHIYSTLLAGANHYHVRNGSVPSCLALQQLAPGTGLPWEAEGSCRGG